MGVLQTKAQWIDFIRSEAFRAQSMSINGVKVRVFGDVAVVTYGQSEKSRFQGKDYSGQTLCIDIFLRRNG